MIHPTREQEAKFDLYAGISGSVSCAPILATAHYPSEWARAAGEMTAMYSVGLWAVRQNGVRILLRTLVVAPDGSETTLDDNPTSDPTRARRA